MIIVVAQQFANPMEEFNLANNIHPEMNERWTFDSQRHEAFQPGQQSAQTKVPLLEVKNNTFEIAGKKSGRVRGAFSSSGLAAAAAMAGSGVSPSGGHHQFHQTGHMNDLYGNQNGKVTWQERVD